jgi:hypothetical protein
MVMNGPGLRLPPKLESLACSDELLTNFLDFLTPGNGTLLLLPELKYVNIVDPISDCNMERLGNTWGTSLTSLYIITENVCQPFHKFIQLTILSVESLGKRKSDFEDMFGKLPVLKALHLIEVHPKFISGVYLPCKLKHFSLTHTERRMSDRDSGRDQIPEEITSGDLPHFPPDMATIKFKVANFDAGVLLSVGAVSTILASKASPSVFVWSCHHSIVDDMLGRLYDLQGLTRASSVRLTGVAVSTKYPMARAGAAAANFSRLTVHLVNRRPRHHPAFDNAVQFKFVTARRRGPRAPLPRI